MTVADTEKALTVDANVVKYYFLFINGHSLPQGLRIQRINDFCACVLDKYPIAINEFIKNEYDQLEGPGPIKNWLKTRVQEDLVIEVDCCPLPSDLRARLRNDYCFDSRSKDARYIATCLNTIFKHFVTEDKRHFCRPHRSRGRRPMHAFLQRELRLFVCTIDGCCSMLLGT